MLKVLTIIGTRPEIIRLSRIIPLLDISCNHILVHTGQNYDNNLNDIFFNEMSIRKPNIIINSKALTVGEQIANIFKEIEKIIIEHKPDKVLILGDTNTSLSAVIVERLGIPVYHMEAGNRCFDLKVPEEKNRKVIDAISSFNLPYTTGSRENLIREGCHKQKLFECGNPINEVLMFYENKINTSNIIRKLQLNKPFILATIHRAENVDNENRFMEIWKALNIIANQYTIVLSCHPRTKNKIEQFKFINNPNLLICEPFGFFDFIQLEKNSFCVLTDSGTVQEECCLLHVPVITIRDSTERPETIECGSNIVSGVNTKKIIDCFNYMIKSNRKWNFPIGYSDINVSTKVVNYILGNQIKYE